MLGVLEIPPLDFEISWGSDIYKVKTKGAYDFLVSFTSVVGYFQKNGDSVELQQTLWVSLMDDFFKRRNIGLPLKSDNSLIKAIMEGLTDLITTDSDELRKFIRLFNEVFSLEQLMGFFLTNEEFQKERLINFVTKTYLGYREKLEETWNAVKERASAKNGDIEFHNAKYTQSFVIDVSTTNKISMLSGEMVANFKKIMASQASIIENLLKNKNELDNPFTDIQPILQETFSWLSDQTNQTKESGKKLNELLKKKTLSVDLLAITLVDYELSKKSFLDDLFSIVSNFLRENEEPPKRGVPTKLQKKYTKTELDFLEKIYEIWISLYAKNKEKTSSYAKLEVVLAKYTEEKKELLERIRVQEGFKESSERNKMEIENSVQQLESNLQQTKNQVLLFQERENQFYNEINTLKSLNEQEKFRYTNELNRIISSKDNEKAQFETILSIQYQEVKSALEKKERELQQSMENSNQTMKKIRDLDETNTTQAMTIKELESQNNIRQKQLEEISSEKEKISRKISNIITPNILTYTYQEPTLEKKIEALEKYLPEKSKEVETLKEKIRDLEHKKNKLSDSLEEKENKEREYNNELKKRESIIDSLEIKTQNITRENQKNLDLINRTIKTKENELSRMENETKEKQAEFESAKNKLKTQIYTIETETNSLKEEIIDNRKKSEKEQKRLQEQNDKLKNDLAKTTLELTKNNALMERLKNDQEQELRAIRQDIKKTQSELSTAQGKNADDTTMINGLRTKISDLEQRLKNTISDNEKSIKDMEKKIEYAELRMKETVDDLVSIKKEKEKQEEVNIERKKEIEKNMEEMTNKFKEEIKNLQTKVELAESDLAKSITKTQIIEREKRDLERDHKTEKAALNKQIELMDQLKKKIEEQKKTVSEVERTHAKLLEDFNRVSANLKTVVSKNDELQAKITENANELSKVYSTMDNMEKIITELSTKLSILQQKIDEYEVLNRDLKYALDNSQNIRIRLERMVENQIQRKRQSDQDIMLKNQKIQELEIKIADAYREVENLRSQNRGLQENLFKAEQKIHETMFLVGSLNQTVGVFTTRIQQLEKTNMEIEESLISKNNSINYLNRVMFDELERHKNNLLGISESVYSAEDHQSSVIFFKDWGVESLDQKIQRIVTGTNTLHNYLINVKIRATQTMQTNKEEVDTRLELHSFSADDIKRANLTKEILQIVSSKGQQLLENTKVELANEKSKGFNLELATKQVSDWIVKLGKEVHSYEHFLKAQERHPGITDELILNLIGNANATVHNPSIEMFMNFGGIMPSTTSAALNSIPELKNVETMEREAEKNQRIVDEIKAISNGGGGGNNDMTLENLIRRWEELQASS